MTVSLIDKNKVFFGLIHYILSEQKNVNWILKTSLIDFTGIYSLLEEKPYAKESIIDDVVDYVTSVKPYHTQFSNYFEHYQTAQETLNIPSNDWIDTKIETKFDSVKSSPDIEVVFNAIDTTAASNYVEGDIIYVKETKTFYKKTNGGWDNYNFYLKKGNYYAKDTKTYYKYTNGNLEEFTDDEIKEFINGHRANRLFYLGLTDLDELKKEMNAGFKGITVNGGAFDIDKFGYDIFDYDTDDYDSPTISYSYYLANYKETIFEASSATFTLIVDATTGKFPYEKTFCKSGEHSFSLPTSFMRTVAEKQAGYVIGVYKVSKGVISYYNDYKLDESVTGNTIDIFNKLKNGEKIYVTVERPDSGNTPALKRAYIIESSTYIESTSPTLMRTFVNYSVDDDYVYLDVPSTDLTTVDKIAIQIRQVNGKAKPLLSPVIVDGKLQIPTGTYSYGDMIYMTAFNYSYLYDKIYTWEDRYGRSNNVVKLFGDKFLRARYEEDRPSELTVSYPLSAVTIYDDNTDSDKTNIFFNDYKNEQYSLNIKNEIKTTIHKNILDDKGMIVGIGIDSNKGFDNPGYALINSEIIYYGSMLETTDASTGLKYYVLGNLKRGMFGSLLYSGLNTRYYPNKQTHKEGDIVIPFNKDLCTLYERNNMYRSYLVDNDIQTDYVCPSGVNYNSAIVVTKNKKITLKEAVTLSSDKIIISSANVVTGYVTSNNKKTPLYKVIEKSSGEEYTGDFVLMINDDIVPFTTIKKNKATSEYYITNFILPQKYAKYDSDQIIYDTDSFISSCIPEEIDIGYTYSESNISYITSSTMYATTKIFTDSEGNNAFKIYDITWSNAIIKAAKVITYKSAENDGSYSIEEEQFGYIKNNVLYKINGEIFGYYSLNRLFTIDVNVVLEDLLVGESVHINVVNGDDSLEPIGKYFEKMNPNKTYTFSIIPTPAASTVKLTAEYPVSAQTGNSIIVYGNTDETGTSNISYSVIYDGYVSVYGSVPYITQDTSLPITIKPYVSVTLNITPDDAEVTFTPEISTREWTADTVYERLALVKYNNKLYNANTGHTSGSTFDSTLWDLVDKKIWVEQNTRINYSITRAGYQTPTFSFVVKENTTKTIELTDLGYFCKEDNTRTFFVKDEDATVNLTVENAPDV